MSKEFKLTIWHDDDTENPFADDNLFTFHSFSNRHLSFSDPDVLLACRFEDEEGYACEEMPTAHAPGRIETHEFDGPQGFMLSYFEHGLCRWGLQGTMTGMPDFRWDGTEFAGWLEVTPDAEGWWAGLTDERKHELAATACESYTDWVNGNNFGYVLEGPKDDDGNRENLDSCFGITGDEWIVDEVRMTLKANGATEENTKIKDKAFGATTYMDFWKVEQNA